MRIGICLNKLDLPVVALEEVHFTVHNSPVNILLREFSFLPLTHNSQVNILLREFSFLPLTQICQRFLTKAKQNLPAVCLDPMATGIGIQCSVYRIDLGKTAWGGFKIKTTLSELIHH